MVSRMGRRKASDYSKQFSRHLRDVMEEHDVRIEPVARKMGRSPSYVSDHTNGNFPPETDLLDTIAGECHMSTPALIVEVVARMSAGHVAEPGENSPGGRPA